MAYYDYQCSKCEHTELIIKSISRYNDPEKCPKCDELMNRLISPGYFCNAKVEEAYFNHGLGCVVRNSKHAGQVAERKGLVEVGNDHVDEFTTHKPYEID